MQLVLMSLDPGEEIGMEVHDDTTQFIRIESGIGMAIVKNLENKYEYTQLGPSSAIMIAAGTWHNIVNTGYAPLKLYTLYSPPHHDPRLIEYTKIIKE